MNEGLSDGIATSSSQQKAADSWNCSQKAECTRRVTEILRAGTGRLRGGVSISNARVTVPCRKISHYWNGVEYNRGNSPASGLATVNKARHPLVRQLWHADRPKLKINIQHRHTSEISVVYLRFTISNLWHNTVYPVCCPRCMRPYRGRYNSPLYTRGPLYYYLFSLLLFRYLLHTATDMQ